MHECAGLNITVGVYVAISAPARYAAAYGVAVVPEVHCEQRLGLAELMYLVIHKFALLRADHKLRHGVRTYGHICEQPGELCANVYHGIYVFLAAYYLRIFACIAAGNAE